jgi:K+-sensing histidine kinase KdpD
MSAVPQQHIRFAKDLGASNVNLKGKDVAGALSDFARPEGITHARAVTFCDLSRASVTSSTMVRNATVQVVPLESRRAEKRGNGSQSSLNL